MATKPKHPTGTFDNCTSGRREVWYDGRLEISHSKDFIDSEQCRNYAFGMSVHPWGHFPDLAVSR